MRHRLLLLSLAFISNACQQMPETRRDIVLNGYSAENYAKLDRVVGEYVCIVGAWRVTSDMDPNFQLSPIVQNGIVSFWYSGLFVRWRDIRSYGTIADGKTYRICGDLRETTLEGCDEQNCRQYDLRKAVLR